ncbi:ATP-binding protein [Pedobacter sp. WC2501]|uniref:ATP-binding protein n=1 Tax=Pedobacter sp. WC2501 TaxID=3461400 RepID=UPI004045B82C
MREIIGITLENEMDLVLAHKRSMQIGEQLGLTVATRTTLATAVSEVARTVIDFTNEGRLSLYISGKFPRFTINAGIKFHSDHVFRETDEGFFYAKKLIPDFNFNVTGQEYSITMALGLPRSARVDEAKILILQDYFINAVPLNSYEEIKNKNSKLSQLTQAQELEIKLGRELDEKKNEFISVASHELKTPITVIKAYTQMLKLFKDQYSEKVGEVVEKLEIQTSKLARLTFQLMDVSKIENGSLQYDLTRIALNSFLNETVTMLTNVYANNKINVQLGDDFSVMADPLRLEQVLSNLIGNAAKYSDKNSNIDVTSFLSKGGGSVTIQITDYGLGMSKESIARIFEKFYRAEDIVSSHPGLGMGLYISSKIVADHGGKIWVNSEMGKGSVFYFTLPLAAHPDL